MHFLLKLATLLQIILPKYIYTLSMTRKKFKHYQQADAMDCGPTCMKMIAAHYGKHKSMAYFRRMCYIGRQGATLAGLQAAATHTGFKSLAVTLPATLLHKAPLPCILHWNKAHYVVLVAIKKNSATIADPALSNMVKIPLSRLYQQWITDNAGERGNALFLTPTEQLQQLENDPDAEVSLYSLLKYFTAYKKKIPPLLLSIIAATGFTVMLPVLTQQVADKAIVQQSTSILLLICLGQLMLFTGKLVMEYLRAKWLFTIGAGTGIRLLYHYLDKLIRLPFSFFDNRQTGDNMQRITDNQRIEEFLTGNLVSIVMAALTGAVLGMMLLWYNWQIFLLFFAGAGITISWSFVFRQKRKLIDQEKFRVLSAIQQLQLEIFQAMQEIKLTGSGHQKKEQLQTLQEKAYQLKLRHLQMDQRMQGSATFINEVKNILIIFITASLVIKGQLTLGAMLAVTYICGQLNAPVAQLIEFIRISQYTRFSLQRMNEIFEEPAEDFHLPEAPVNSTPADIHLSSLCFRYGQPGSAMVLKNISLHLPAGKVTAIVGMSGSGKSTLIKLLLKFYQPVSGDIYIGENDLAHIHANSWRQRCGGVLQDGYIFSDTIAANICTGAGNTDTVKMQEAARMAQLHHFISSLPYGYDTVIGKDGYGLSSGQQQRLLIARMIYRNPSYIFLDEATNALDASNEKHIVQNLEAFFKGKTVVVVAHRLSTVKNADQIIVMHQGEIAETGTHESLVAQQGKYFHLIKNQLEIAKV